MLPIKTSRKPIIFVLLCTALVSMYIATDLKNYLSFESLVSNKNQLQLLVSNNYSLSVVMFMASYIIIAMFSLPLAALLSIAGGVMFGLVAVWYVVIAASIGALLNMLIVRYFLRELMEQQFSTQSTLFNAKLSTGAVSYLLFVHLLPVFPFFLINILAGISRVKANVFFWTTLIGIFPGALVYVYAGTKLNSINNPQEIITPEIIGVFVLLSICSLLPKLLIEKKVL